MAWRIPAWADVPASVVWSPAVVNQTLQIGESATLTVSLTIAGDDDIVEDGIQVIVSPEIVPFLAVDPSAFGGDGIDDNGDDDGDGDDNLLSESLTFTFSAPLDAAVGTISGTVTLHSVEEGTLSPALTVTLELIDQIAPVVAITAPADLSTVNTTSVNISGTLDDPTATLTVAGLPVTVADGQWSTTLDLLAVGLAIEARATDPAGNVGSDNIDLFSDAEPPLFVLEEPGNGASVNTSPLLVRGFVNEEDSTVTVNGVAAAVNGTDWSATVPLVEGLNTIAAEARDLATNLATASVTVTLDTQPPTISITSPEAAGVLGISPVLVEGAIDDPSASILVNGVPASSTGGTWTALVPLVDGANLIVAVAEDPATNQATASVQVALDSLPPVVAITGPENLSAFNAGPVTVEGTQADPTAFLTVNGKPVAVVDGLWSTTVDLGEGLNLVTAVAEDPLGNIGTTSIQLILDTQPPVVVIDSPPDGFVTDQAEISVAGMINDIVVGTVGGENAVVTVNGTVAQVANRSFLAEAVTLQLGPNTITSSAEDQAGNLVSASIIVTRKDMAGQKRIRLISGNTQTGQIASKLAEPLIVALEDSLGNPVAGETVIFKVTENSGTLSDGTETARGLAVATDVAGQAEVLWTLGTRAGAGNNVVEAMAAGFEGTAIFTAGGLPTAGEKIYLDTGNDQVGVAGEPLPMPFVAIVTDSGNNRLADVAVTFTVRSGGGEFNGAPSVTVDTDSNGRAVALMTLGAQEGVRNSVVDATFPGNPGTVSRFVASGKAAGDPALTAVSGVVLDNTNEPISGVTLSIEGTGLTTQSDFEGQFSMIGVPVGPIHLLADGGTAERDGTWPSLAFELFTIAGQDNTLGMPIFLLPLDLPNGLFVDETTGGTLTLPQMPGFALTVEPGSATFPGGDKAGIVSVTVVHADKIPMTPNFGQQPRFIVTIQPSGTVFDPPAAMTLPNTDGLVPGEVTEMYSFDHDLAQFVSIGTGTVSNDGILVATDPGVGIVEGGWHCGGNPAETGAAGNCPECEICEGDGCVPIEIEAFEILTTPANDANFSFLAERSFGNVAQGTRIVAQAKLTPSDTDIETDIEWSVTAPSGDIRGEQPPSKKGPDFSFVPNPLAHPAYEKARNVGGSKDRSKPLSYAITAKVCSSSVSITVKQDQIDIIRQEYANHGLPVPKRTDLSIPRETTNFSLGEIKMYTSYDFGLGQPGELGQSVRDAYNKIVYDDEQVQEVGTENLAPMAVVVGPGKTQIARLGLVRNTPRCHLAVSPECDDEVVGETIVAGDNGVAETFALNLTANFQMGLSSAWRNPERNERVGGVINSRHQFGNAVDLKITNRRGILSVTELYCIAVTAARSVAGISDKDAFTENSKDSTTNSVPCDAPVVTHLHVEK